MKFTSAAILMLCGCASLVPSTVLRLGMLSPMTADPAGFAVELQMPEGIDVRPGSARLSFVVSRGDNGQTAGNVFTLKRSGSVFVVAPADVPLVRQLQTTARQWKAEEDSATTGSLSITLSPCLVEAGPEPDARISVGLRVVEGGDFLPLVRNGPLSSVADAEDIAAMTACL